MRRFIPLFPFFPPLSAPVNFCVISRPFQFLSPLSCFSHQTKPSSVKKNSGSPISIRHGTSRHPHASTFHGPDLLPVTLLITLLRVLVEWERLLFAFCKHRVRFLFFAVLPSPWVFTLRRDFYRMLTCLALAPSLRRHQLSTFTVADLLARSARC